MSDTLRWYSRPELVSLTPIATTVCLEYANVGQLWRMWHVHSALGQNVWSWVAVQLALWGWGNYYRVMLPKQMWARRANAIGIALNMAVVLTVVYFRWIA